MIRFTLAVGLGLASIGAFAHAQDNPVTVRFHEPKMDNVQVFAPVDPTVRIRVTGRAGFMFGLATEKNQMLSNGYLRPSLKIDGQVMYPQNNMAGVVIGVNVGGPAAAQKFPMKSEFVRDKISLTQTLEPIATKTKDPQAKRQLDSMLVKYVVENKDSAPHKVGIRIRMDMYLINNDGALFAAPTMPGKILDGVELKGPTLPEYVQVLQVANLQNPGFVAHFTLKLGGGMIPPDRFLCTAHGLGDNGWDIAAQRSNGDSDAVIFWDPREIPPGGKVTFAMAYGKGLASFPDREGQIKLLLGGSFEPGKTFTIQAFVEEPLPSQTLKLELPAGMQRVEGREIQPVPAPAGNLASSIVMWKGRVEKLGEFPIKIRSSTGAHLTRTVSISR